MSKNTTNQGSAQSHESTDQTQRVQTQEKISRRKFLGTAGLLTAAGVLAPSISSTALAETVDTDVNNEAGSDLSEQYQNDSFGTLHSKRLRNKAHKARIKSAELEYNIDIPPQPNNGDEAAYPNKISVSTKA